VCLIAARAAALFVLAFTARSVMAQQPAQRAEQLSRSTEQNVALAKEAFLKGQTLYASGKFADALKKFEESYEAKPHPATIFNIARCQDRLGDLVRAMTSYKEYLRQAPQATDAEEVSKAIGSIEQRFQAKGVQHILVYVEPATARVLVNGKDIGTSPAATTLSPGTHALTLSADGYDSYERTFALSATRSTELTISMRSSATKPPAPLSAPDAPGAVVLTPTPTSAPESGGEKETVVQPRRWTFVAGGLAVAGVAAGVVTAVLSANAQSQLNMLDPTRTRMQADELIAARATNAVIATSSFIFAGVALAAAVVLFFVEGPGQPAMASAERSRSPGTP
jgi:Tfp pilus assembly protein PilF